MIIDQDKITPPLDPMGLSNRIFFRGQVLFVRSLLNLAFRFKVNHSGYPVEGPLIVAANHLSLLDPIVLQAAVKQRLHFLMTSDFYFKPLLNRYFRIMRCIPVLEERFNRKALQSALEVLSAGRTIAIFPQGGLRSAEDFDTTMRGVAYLAMKSGAPLLPIRLEGTGAVLPKGALVPRFAPVKVNIGRPLEFKDLTEADTTRSTRRLLQEITAKLMSTIRES